MLNITEDAAAVIERSYDAAARFDPEAKIRISLQGDRVATGFVHTPEEGDLVVEQDGFTLYADPALQGTLDVSGEHDQLVIVPGG